MTEVELAAVVKGIAPVIRELVAAGVKDAYARLAALETKELPLVRDGIDGPAGPAGEKGIDGTPGAQGERGPEGQEGKPGRDGRDGLPGVPGLAGEKGMDGTHGLHGKDGLGFEDLSVEHDGERGFTLRATRGDQVKALGTFTIPALIYRGVYIEGKAYEHGDVSTWGGSTWYASETTTAKPGEGSKAWQLIVKRGRDGRDGKDFTPQPIPVVKVGK